MGIWAFLVLTSQSNFIHMNFNMLLFIDTTLFYYKIQGPVTWQIVKFMFDPHGKAHF